jgi:Tol biopolymer transport system component
MSRRDGNWDIYSVKVDGSGLTRLTTDDADDGLPIWSPDGSAIAFLSNRGGPWAVWAMTPSGTGIRQLFTLQGSPDGFVASEPTTDTTRGWAEERISWTR